MMLPGITLSLLLAAAGAILLWAVEAEVSGINVDAVGVILLVVACIGFIVSVAFGLSYDRRDRTVVEKVRDDR